MRMNKLDDKKGHRGASSGPSRTLQVNKMTGSVM